MEDHNLAEKCEYIQIDYQRNETDKNLVKKINRLYLERPLIAKKDEHRSQKFIEQTNGQIEEINHWCDSSIIWHSSGSDLKD